MELRIGCSGYHYRHWQGGFYPDALPVSKWFAFYAGRFDTVEINASYYRFPTAQTAHHWREQAPAHFVYSLKAPGLITHRKCFQDCEGLMHHFYTVAAAMGDTLGCLLFQLPPNLAFSSETLARVLQPMDAGFRNVIEFRHASWWRDEVYDTLRAKGVAFCAVVAPELPDTLITTAPDLYLRLHGAPWYNHDFSEAELQQLHQRIMASGAERAWVYFNNDANAWAPANAAILKQMFAH